MLSLFAHSVFRCRLTILYYSYSLFIFRFAEIGTNAAAINFFPFLKHLPIPEIREVFEIDKVVRSFLQRMIEDHKETLDETRQRDFIDAYLLEIKRRQEVNLFPLYFNVISKNC